MLTKVTSEDFQGLTNPYTGKPMTVFMLTGSGPVRFTCPDTFSTADLADTTAQLYDNWNRKNGVSGLRTGQTIRCAYTGELLSVKTRFGKVSYVGGFDPHRFYTREEFLYYAWMRDGKSKFPVPVKEESRVKAPSREGKVTEEQKCHADKEAPSLDDEKIHLVEASMKKHKDQLETSSTVSMSVSGRGNRRGR